MLPNQEQAEQQPPELLSDGGATFAAQLSDNANATRIGGVVYGGLLGLIAIGGAAAVGLSYVAVPTEPHAQAAAVAETQSPRVFFTDIEIGARAGYVLDARDNRELFAKNASLQLPLASITKIMLVLAVAEVLAPDEIVTISDAVVLKVGNGLTWGEEWRFKDLVDYTLITSSNTGAEALAEAADAKLRAKYPEAPRGRAAVWRMNSIAQEIGLDETYFINATGLDEATTQAGALGSARDVAFLFKYALETNRELFAGTTRSGAALGPVNYPERAAVNTNEAVADIPGLLISKTGTTDLAGGNLAVAFVGEESRPIIVVILGATPDGRFADVKALAEAARKAFSGAN